MCWDAGNNSAGRQDAFHVLFVSGNNNPVKRPWLAQAAVAELANQESPPRSTDSRGKKPGGPGVAECEQRIAC